MQLQVVLLIPASPPRRDMLLPFVRTLLCTVYKGSHALIGDKLTTLLWSLYLPSPPGLFENDCLRAFVTQVSKLAVSGGGKAIDRRHGERVLEHHRRVFGKRAAGPSEGPLGRTAFGIAVSDLINDCRFLCSS